MIDLLPDVVQLTGRVSAVTGVPEPHPDHPPVLPDPEPLKPPRNPTQPWSW